MKALLLVFFVLGKNGSPQTNFNAKSLPNRKIFVRGDRESTARAPASVPAPTNNVFGNADYDLQQTVVDNSIAIEDEPTVVIVEETRIPNSVDDQASCCCIPTHEECRDDLTTEEELDLVGLGLINPRIVNRPGVTLPASEEASCPTNYKLCCSAPSTTSILGRSTNCLAPTKVPTEQWVQGCQETPVFGELMTGVKGCGSREVTNTGSIAHGETLPGEFPWSCLILNQNNEFIGSCAIIPSDSGNKNEAGVRKVLTAAHKLNDVLDTE